MEVTGQIHVSSACSNGKRIPGSEEVRGCDTSNAKPPLYLGRVKLFIQLISRHIIVYNMPTHTSDCSTYVLWSWVKDFLSPCSCASTLYYKTQYFCVNLPNLCFSKNKVSYFKGLLFCQWLPISSYLYCWQMAGHIYFSMMKHVENLRESDIIHFLNYYNQLHSPTDAHNKI